MFRAGSWTFLLRLPCRVLASFYGRECAFDIATKSDDHALKLVAIAAADEQAAQTLLHDIAMQPRSHGIPAASPLVASRPRNEVRQRREKGERLHCKQLKDCKFIDVQYIRLTTFVLRNMTQ